MQSFTRTNKRTHGRETGGLEVTRNPQITETLDQISLIGAASGLGSPQPGCGAGPDTLRRSGLERTLRQRGINAFWRATVRPLNIKDIPSARSSICLFSKNLSAQLAKVAQSGSRFVVIGGDHSCAIGTWSGVASTRLSQGPLGLIWIDAHMDSHTPTSSPSGALHGMPLACLLGYGDMTLRNIEIPGPKLLSQHVCLVGVHSYEKDEADLLNRLGIRIFFMDEVTRRGLPEVLCDAIEIASNGTAGFGISIDLDAIDPIDAPGVGTPEPGGLSGVELIESLAQADHYEKLVGLEIAEFNPLLDRGGRTARLIEDLICASLAKSREIRHVSDH